MTDSSLIDRKDKKDVAKYATSFFKANTNEL